MHISIPNGKAKPLQLITLYRPPNSPIKNSQSVLENFLNNINYSEFPLIVTGDFNIDISKKYTKQ